MIHLSHMYGLYTHTLHTASVKPCTSTAISRARAVTRTTHTYFHDVIVKLHMCDMTLIHERVSLSV